jgi:hypothetical protein
MLVAVCEHPRIGPAPPVLPCVVRLRPVSWCTGWSVSLGGDIVWQVAAITLAVIAIGFRLFKGRIRRGHRTSESIDVGAVSERWLAEKRGSRNDRS